MEKTIKIPLEDKIVTLTVDDGDGHLDTEDILRIDYSNIIGEMLTFPVIVNRIGILKSQMEASLREKKFEVDIYKANLAENLRKSLSKKDIGAGGLTKIKAPVKDSVDNAVTLDVGYQAKMRELFRVERNSQYVESLYWAVKSKDDKLRAIGGHIVPKEFEKEIVDGVINGIKIKGTNKAFKTSKSS